MRIALLAAGCHALEPVTLPVGGSATLMAIAGDDGSVEITALAPGDPAPPFTLDETGVLALLSYDATLETLGIAPGRVPLVADEPSRPLPRAASIQIARAEGGGLGPFSIEAALPAAFLDARIRGITASACASREGCYEDLNRATDGDCTFPCPGSHGPTSTVSPPLPPELPRFDSCPVGFVREPFGAVAACVPPERTACDPDEVQLVGESACAPLGLTCPADGFHPSIALADPNVLFVRPGAMGIGTSADPFGTADEALAVAVSGQVIALSIGGHTMTRPIPDGVRVVGACAEGTTIDGAVTLVLDAVLESVAARRISVAAGGRLDVREVIAEGAFPVEVYGRLEGERLVVRGAPMLAIDADVVLSDSLFFDGLSLEQGLADLTRIYVRGGPGVRARGTSLVLRDSLVEDVVETAIHQLEGSMTLDGVRVRRVAVDGRGALGHAVYFAFGPFTVRRAVVTDAFTSGIWVFQAGGSFEDVVVARIAATPFGGGNGLNLQDSQVTARRVWLSETTNSAVGLSEQPNVTNASMEDVTIEDMKGADAAAFDVLVASSFSAQRVRLRRSTGGLIRSFGDADLTLDDVEVEDAREATDQCVLLVSGSSQLTGHRLAVHEAARDVICSEIAATVSLEDVRVESIAAYPVRILDGELSIERGAFSTSRNAVYNRKGHLTLGDTEVRSVMTGSCVELDIANSVRLSRFRLSGCPNAGISGNVTGEVRVSGGIIEGSPIGVDVEGDPKPFITDVIFDTDMPVRE